jgi:hypothetical protein
MLMMNAEYQIQLPLDHPYWERYGLKLHQLSFGWRVIYRDFSTARQSHDFGDDVDTAKRFFDKMKERERQGIAICSHVDAGPMELAEYEEFWCENKS